VKAEAVRFNGEQDSVTFDMIPFEMNLLVTWFLDSDG